LLNFALQAFELGLNFAALALGGLAGARAFRDFPGNFIGIARKAGAAYFTMQ